MSREIARGEGPQMAKIRQQACFGDGQHRRCAIEDNCSFSFNDYSSNSEVQILYNFWRGKKGGNMAMEKYWDLRLKKCKSELKKNNFDAFIAQTPSDAKKIMHLRTS